MGRPFGRPILVPSRSVTGVVLLLGAQHAAQARVSHRAMRMTELSPVVPRQTGVAFGCRAGAILVIGLRTTGSALGTRCLEDIRHRLCAFLWSCDEMGCHCLTRWTRLRHREFSAGMSLPISTPNAQGHFPIRCWTPLLRPRPSARVPPNRQPIRRLPETRASRRNAPRWFRYRRRTEGFRR